MKGSWWGQGTAQPPFCVGPKTRISIVGLADSDVGRIVAMMQESKAPDVELTIPTSKRHIVERKILSQ